MKKDANDPSQTSAAHDVMAPRLFKMRSVLGGTETMRAAGQDLLPQHESEGKVAYNERLARTTLYNLTGMTLKSWVGQVFADPVERNPGLPQEITALFDDVDLCGNNVDVFAREWFEDGVSLGVSPVMVLFPTAQETPTDRPRTKKDDQIEALRPFWARIAPENVLAVRTGIDAEGREIFTHVRLLDGRIGEDGFSDVYIPQIHVYTPGLVITYEPADLKKKTPEWVEVGRQEYDFSEVPMVVFYAEKEDTMQGTCALMDMADLNIQHWQSTSDQIACLTVARFPLLSAVGVNEDEKIVIGPRKMLRSENPDAKFGYVEHTGAALSAGAADLKSLEDRMANYGAEFLKKRPGRETKGARELDSSEATSQIEDAAQRFNDSLDMVLYLTSRWLKIDEPEAGGLKVQTRLSDDDEKPTGDETTPTPPE